MQEVIEEKEVNMEELEDMASMFEAQSFEGREFDAKVLKVVETKLTNREGELVKDKKGNNITAYNVEVQIGDRGKYKLPKIFRRDLKSLVVHKNKDGMVKIVSEKDQKGYWRWNFKEV